MQKNDRWCRGIGVWSLLLICSLFAARVSAGPPQYMPLIPVSDFDMLVYGSIRTGVLNDNGNVQVADGASRLGFAVGHDLGNGLGAIAVYEFGVWSSAGSIVTPELWGVTDPQRHTYVGLKGDWGAITLGSQWAPLAGAIGNYMDKSNYFGGQGFVNGQYRIPYSVAFQRCWNQNCTKALFMDAQMSSGGDDLDRTTVGGNWLLNKLTIGAAYQDHGNDDFRGVSFQMPLELLGRSATLAGGYVSTQTTGNGWDINLQLGNLWLDYGVNASNSAKIIVDYLYPLTKNFALIGEVYVENDVSKDAGVVLLKYDF